jgi:hypothetical protein
LFACYQKFSHSPTILKNGGGVERVIWKNAIFRYYDENASSKPCLIL